MYLTSTSSSITPVSTRPCATAGSAALTLQSRLAQESVVVRGSPRSFSGNSSHDGSPQHSVAQVLSSLLSVRIKSRASSHRFISDFTEESSCRYSALLQLESSWVVCGAQWPLLKHHVLLRRATIKPPQNFSAVPQA